MYIFLSQCCIHFRREFALEQGESIASLSVALIKIKTTVTKDYYNPNPSTSIMSEETTILLSNKVLQDEGKQISCEQIKLLKFSDDLVQLEEEEEDVENFTSTDRGDDNEEDEEEDEERDLTNLTWLTELRNQTMGFVNMALDEETKKDGEFTTVAIKQTCIQQPTHLSQLSENDIAAKSNANILEKQKVILQIPQHRSDEPRPKILNQPKRPSPAERYEMFLNKIKRDLEIYEQSADNYQSDIVEKPPFNYSHIIGMAMLENGRRVTLQQICSWIERKFAFFRVRKKWNNSIRHNLSLHPCFRKIGRNKEDKGKGGYWELGVDPKKCDRKRIRNRKSTAQPAKMQKKHLQAHFIKTTKRRQQNLTNMKKINLKHCTGNVRNFPSEQVYEELLLDEMDVQQNIDVMSTNVNNHNNNITTTDTCYKNSEPHSALQQIYPTRKHNNQSTEKEELMLTNFIKDTSDDHIHLPHNNDFQEFNKSCSLADDNICLANEHSSQHTCQHQYKLGTIIISSATMSADMPKFQNINQRTINSFLTASSTKQLLTKDQECTNSIHYSQAKDVPQNENVISSYVSNFSDGFSTCTQESKSNQSHNFASPSPSNSITLDFSAFPAQLMQQKPNAIVEHLIQQPSLNYSATEVSPDCMSSSSPLNTSTATMCTIGSQNGGYPNGLVNEYFRPYIDGIDEAFQYLRSIDSTRNEDILDNLLDISVSDY